VTCRFEQLALGYDEDDIGSLADDDPDIAVDTAVDDFSDALVIFKTPSRQSQPTSSCFEHGCHILTPHNLIMDTALIAAVQCTHTFAYFGNCSG